MSDIKVTQAEIDLLLNSADVQVRTEFGKCTVVTVRLRNGFILTESSACVDPANYEEDRRGARCEVQGGGSENARLCSCVPWLASQTDMLAEDWEIAEVQHG